MTTLTAQPGTLSASLVDALGGPEPERALEQAFIQLARGGDLPLVLAMLKALVRIRLAGIAVRLLHSAGGLLTAEPQLAALADQLAAMPSGEVSTTVLQDRFKRNRSHLLKSRPQLEPIVDQVASAIGDARVFVSKAGNVQVVRENAGRKLDFVFPFADQIGQVCGLRLPEVSLTSSYLMVGVPNVPLWERLLALKTESGFQPPIDIVEPDASILGIWLHLIDQGEALADERVNIFCGESAVDEYREFLSNHIWRRPATHASTNFRPRWTPPVLNGKFHETIAARINQKQAQIVRNLEARSAGRDAAWWARRFQQAMCGGPPLRIAGFTTRYSTVIQHSMRDLATAFERRGCTFDLIKQPNPYCAHVDVTGALSTHDYDLIVVIDHLRSEFAGSIPARIPFVCWIQDHMDALYTPQAGASVTDLDVVVGQSPGLMASAYGYPLSRFVASSNLTDPHTYSNEPLPENELAAYRCDVSYIGHGSATPVELAREIAVEAPRAFGEMLQHFLQIARARLATKGWLTFADRMELALQAERESGHPAMTPAIRRRIVLPAVDRLFDRMIRHETLEWTAQWAESRGRKLRIFGKGWERHSRFAKFASGEVSNGRELRATYQASAMSVQVTAYASLHQRLLDGLCCGATLVARFNPFDFLRRPHGVAAKFIAEQRIHSLARLLQIAESEPTLNAALRELHSFGYVRLAPKHDAQRRSEAELYRACFDADEASLGDEGLFESLRTGRYIPHRSASDLPGFDEIVFDSPGKLHGLLDRLIDDETGRRRISGPMRECVLKHDTHDVLVQRVLEKFVNPASKP